MLLTLNCSIINLYTFYADISDWIFFKDSWTPIFPYINGLWVFGAVQRFAKLYVSLATLLFQCPARLSNSSSIGCSISVIWVS